MTPAPPRNPDGFPDEKPSAKVFWAIASQVRDESMALFESWLTPGERSGLRPSGSRRIFRDRVLARGLLRLALSEELSTPASSLVFSRLSSGKLILSGKGGEREGGLDFSISHSWGAVACAVLGTGRIGVDLEGVERTNPFRGLMGRCLTQQEQAHLDTVPSAARTTEFLKFWTLKEAYLKAAGHGLTRIPASVGFTLPQPGPGRPGMENPVDGENLTLFLCQFPPRWIGAVVAEGREIEVSVTHRSTL